MCKNLESSNLLQKVKDQGHVMRVNDPALKERGSAVVINLSTKEMLNTFNISFAGHNVMEFFLLAQSGQQASVLLAPGRFPLAQPLF